MESKDMFRALFDYATIGMIVCNQKAEIINFNRQAELQFGYTKEEILYNKIEILIPQKYRHSHEKERDGFYKKPQARVMGAGRDLFGRKKDGSEFPIEISLSNYQSDGETFVIAFVIDITVRKLSEYKLVEQRNELEHQTHQIKQLNIELEQMVENRTKMLRETLAALEKSKEELSTALEQEKELGDLKSRFVTMASHEFRTPLSTILSSAFLLSKYPLTEDNEKREKHIQRIKNAVGDMKSILEDFLSLGKLEEGTLHTSVEDYEFEEIVDGIKELLNGMQQIAKKEQQLAFSFSGAGKCRTDVNIIKNVLLNLVSNAIKFSPENSVISVTADKIKDYIILVVKDCGIGISAEDQQRLFERFFRAKNALNIQGTGLGLHIVGRYLELINGSIKFESELNKGTSFIVQIPVTD